MSSPLDIIKEALSTRDTGVGLVTAVKGLSVKLATQKGLVDAVSLVQLNPGDRVIVTKGIAVLSPTATIVESV